MAVAVTLVTGFLGAGKTSLINQVLSQIQENPQEIVVIVNEVGEVGIDHQLMVYQEDQIYQLNNGCMCCQLRGDLMTGLLAIEKDYLERQAKLSHIIIEASGIADPLSIIQTIQAANSSKMLYYLDSVFTLVDAVNYPLSIQQYPEQGQQIIYGDRIYITKADQPHAVSQDWLKEEVASLNPLAEIVVLEDSQPVTPDQFFNQGLHRQTELGPAVEDLAHDHEHESEGHHHHHHHHHQIETLYLRGDQDLNRVYLQQFLDWLLYNFKDQLYRYKGLLAVEGMDFRLALQGVNLHYEFMPSQHVKDEEDPVSELVLIGRDLREDLIVAAFNDILTASADTKQPLSQSKE